MNAEFDALDALPLRAVEVHVEVAERELRKLPFEGGWLDARSTRAPTVMSPLMPEEQSRKRTFMVNGVVRVEKVGVRRRSTRAGS